MAASLAFGPRLRELRETAKATLADVSKEMGWSVVYLSDIERGRRNPPETEKIKKLADILRAKACELFDLANKDRKRVELDLEGKTPGVEQAALVLARSWEDLSEKKAKEILKILGQEECQL